MHGRTIGTSAIHIADYRAVKGKDELELDVLVSDEEFWD